MVRAAAPFAEAAPRAHAITRGSPPGGPYARRTIRTAYRVHAQALASAQKEATKAVGEAQRAQEAAAKCVSAQLESGEAGLDLQRAQAEAAEQRHIYIYYMRV